MDLKISKRLMTVAGLVPGCDTLADIGSDHGLLPLYLLQQKRIRNAYCCDIKQGPLEAASRNIRAWGLEHAAETLLGDGLAPVHGKSHQCAVIAGMGGETIAQILEDDGIGAADPRVFVLQPMSRANVLRTYLASHGFAVTEFALCEDAGRLYECFTAVKSTDVETDPFFLYLGRRGNAEEALYRRYVEEHRFRLEGMLEGILRSNHPDAPEGEEYRALLAEFERRFGPPPVSRKG